MNNRMNFFTRTVVYHRKILFRDAVEAPSLELEALVKPLVDLIPAAEPIWLSEPVLITYSVSGVNEGKQPVYSRNKSKEKLMELWNPCVMESRFRHNLQTRGIVITTHRFIQLIQLILLVCIHLYLSFIICILICIHYCIKYIYCR